MLAEQFLRRTSLIPERLESPARTCVTIERASEIFGSQFFGSEAAEEVFGIKVENLPPLTPTFTEERLGQAKNRGELLILNVGEFCEGEPTTMQEMEKRLQPQFDKEKKGKILFDTRGYEGEAFFTQDAPKYRWMLVSKEVLPNSLGKNYLEQTELLASYACDTLFGGGTLPLEYKEAIEEFKDQRVAIAKIMDINDEKSYNWKEAARRLAGLKLNQLLRQTPSEVMYADLLYFQNTGNRLLPSLATWTIGCESYGRLVYVDYFGSAGLVVCVRGPGYSRSDLGVCPSQIV